MFRLRTFGPLRLERTEGDVPVTATPRRQLALLSIIASAGGAGITREKTALLLWPESDGESARHSLSQLLYSLRQAFCSDPVIATAGNLRLNPGVITSDVGDFDAALAADNPEAAASFYAGPFLDGFNPPDSEEFEKWMDTERARRARQIASAIEQLATRAASNSEFDDAVMWWRKAATLDPVDSRIAMSLMQALDAAGNRPGALQHAQIHSSQVREELGIDPDQLVTAYEAQLQSELPRVRSESRFQTRQFVTPAVSNDDEVPQEASAANGAGPDKNKKRLAAALTLLGITAFAFLVAMDDRRSDPSANATPTVAVLRFSVHGDSSVAYLGEGLVDLLSSDLDGAGDLRAVDPRSVLQLSDSENSGDPEHGRAIAKRFGADLFVLGDVTNAGKMIRISAGLYSSGEAGGPLVSTTAEGNRESLFELVDALAVKLLAARYQGPRERLMRTAAVTSRSLPALKWYLDGESEFRAGRYARAVEAFNQAVAVDTTFALAYYRMSIAAEWEGRPDLASRGAERALRFSSRLSDHDRQLVEALSARRMRDADRAELLYRRIVAEFPDDVDAWYQLGEVLFHDNANRGRSFTESHEAWQHVLELVPSDPDALLHEIRVIARTGSPAELDSLITLALPVLKPQQRLETEAFRAFTIGSAQQRDSMLNRLSETDTEIAWQALWRVAVYGRNIAGAKRLAQLLSRPGQSRADEAKGHEAMMLLLLAEGRRSAALAEGAKVGRRYPWSRDVGQIYFQSLGLVTNDSSAVRQLRSRFDSWVPPTVDEAQLLMNPQGVLGQEFKAYSEGMLSNALGETSVAISYADKLVRMKAPTAVQDMPGLFAVVLRATAARKAGNRAGALALLENWRGTAPLELGGALGVEPYFGWMRAELLNESGRESEALRWYDSRVDLFISEVIYLAPAALRAGEIYERRGDVRKAIDKYRLVVELWGKADPELQPLVAEARSKLARMTGAISRSERLTAR